MASTRVFLRVSTRALPFSRPLGRGYTTQSFPTPRPPRCTRPAAPRHNPSTQTRWHSKPASTSQTYNFDEIKALTEHPSPDRILIDVREPSELSTTGHIPTATNIPIGTHPDAFFLPADEFEAQFGFAKPEPDTEVVFYCKAGVRSSAAAKLALQGGYERVGEYRGSWVEWVGRGGGVERG